MSVRPERICLRALLCRPLRCHLNTALLSLIASLLIPAGVVSAQSIEQRGYFEMYATGFPQSAPGDSGKWIGESLLRYEPSFRLGPFFQIHTGIDGRSDTHRQVERKFAVSYWDRSIQRPAIAVRRFSLSFFRGPVSLEIGKQFVRWGKTDVLNPTDRFAPRDYLAVVDNEFLAVTAARLTLSRDDETLEMVYTPKFTPSRIPLLNQRWTVVPEAARGLPLDTAEISYPGGPQFGVRWNHGGSGLEYSLSFFQGCNHLPLIQPSLLASPARIRIARDYPRLRTYGGDVAAPLPWLTFKAEAAWFQSPSPNADEYVLYVAQVERQYREWLFIGGYTGEHVTRERNPFDFAPDRGIAKAIVARASLTIDTNRSLLFECVARQNGKGFYGKFEYSHALGSHWRATARFVLIRGSDSDFLGQYHRNSSGALATRYSF